MNFETVPAAEFGKALLGVTLNLLVRDVRTEAAILTQVFGCAVHRLSDDYAIVLHKGQPMQLHSDASFAQHPIYALLPEAGPRGAGMEIRLHGADPDLACMRAAQVADLRYLGLPA